MVESLVDKTPLALVFTDVVGSSAAKREVAPGADASARDRAYLEGVQAKHLRLVRGAVAEQGGREIMTMGDGFFLTFPEARAALRCAAEMQRQLASKPIPTARGPLQLRIGIHLGTPEFFENSWHGADVDLAARAQAAASPGQIIVTDAARQTLGEPPGIELRELGFFALKGVGDVKLWDADYDQHGPRVAAILSHRERKRRQLVGLGIVGVLLLTGVALGWREHHRQPVKPAAPSSIIVADFDNQAHDPVFDNTLTKAFTIQLQQSPVLNVVSPEHLRQSMRYLGKSPEDPLTPAVAREIGVREGVKAYVSGSVSQVGAQYLILAQAIDPETGDSVASEQAQAADKNHVLDALSAVATALRTHLGESLASVQKLDTPLGQATTPSLEAFRAFALGDAEHLRGNDIPGAEGHYRQALDLDPKFAMAWARLGAVYSNAIQFGKSAECFTRAFELSKNVSERERLFIESNYYISVTGELQKMVDTARLGCQIYPLDSGIRTELGVAQNSLGQLAEALQTSRRALDLAPGSAIANSNFLSSLIKLDKFPEAQKAAAELKRLNLDDTDDTISIYSLHFLVGDAAGMERDRAVTRGRDDEYLMTAAVAASQEFAGRYDEAEQSWKHAAGQAAQKEAKDVAATFLLSRLMGRHYAGLREDSAPVLQAALALDQSKLTRQLAAYTAALCNEPKVALPLLAELARAYPKDTDINQVIVPQSRAALELAAHHPAAALRELEGFDSFDLISPGAYLRGLAYLDLHNGPAAVDAFRRASQYRGAALLCFVQDYGQAQLGLARALALTGDKAAAKKAYEALLQTWSDADAELPQLVAANREYAALR